MGCNRPVVKTTIILLRFAYCAALWLEIQPLRSFTLGLDKRAHTDTIDSFHWSDRLYLMRQTRDSPENQRDLHAARFRTGAFVYLPFRLGSSTRSCGVIKTLPCYVHERMLLEISATLACMLPLHMCSGTRQQTVCRRHYFNSSCR